MAHSKLKDYHKQNRFSLKEKHFIQNNTDEKHFSKLIELKTKEKNKFPNANRSQKKYINFQFEFALGLKRNLLFSLLFIAFAF